MYVSNSSISTWSNAAEKKGPTYRVTLQKHFHRGKRSSCPFSDLPAPALLQVSIKRKLHFLFSSWETTGLPLLQKRGRTESERRTSRGEREIHLYEEPPSGGQWQAKCPPSLLPSKAPARFCQQTPRIDLCPILHDTSFPRHTNRRDRNLLKLPHFHDAVAERSASPR